MYKIRLYQEKIEEGQRSRPTIYWVAEVIKTFEDTELPIIKVEEVVSKHTNLYREVALKDARSCILNSEVEDV